MQLKAVVLAQELKATACWPAGAQVGGGGGGVPGAGPDGADSCGF